VPLRNWFRVVPARERARLRLVCFPHAGGSASFFRSWARYLPDTVELAAVCYPGREDRICDPLPERMEDLAAPLDEDLDERSVGAWAALTRACFTLRAMPGGHFYLSDDTAGLVHDLMVQVGPAELRDPAIAR
jgi:surfactin synthase thioesterase subunit